MCSKIRFRTRSYAKTALVSAHGAKTGMAVYMCQCGWWHWGHAPAVSKEVWRSRG